MRLLESEGGEDEVQERTRLAVQGLLGHVEDLGFPTSLRVRSPGGHTQEGTHRRAHTEKRQDVGAHRLPLVAAVGEARE